MKKYTKIAYIVLAIIILLSGFFIYKVSGKNNSNESLEDKTLAEVQHLESEFEDLFNQLNNISFENYKLSSTQTEENENKSSGASENTTGNQGSDTGNSEESESSGDSKSSESSSDSSNSEKQYNLEEVGVLTQDSDIDWAQIKNDVENIYTSLYAMTIDLYQTSTEQQDIINFNKEYDNLTKAVKEENKQDSLTELSTLYDYLPIFVENCTDDEKEITIIKTKNYIFKAYSLLDNEEWNTISNNINSATQEITKLVTNINNDENGNQYNINKAYVMINELQNAVTLKDREVFLIKYKNLLEELQNI